MSVIVYDVVFSLSRLVVALYVQVSAVSVRDNEDPGGAHKRALLKAPVDMKQNKMYMKHSTAMFCF